MYLYIKYVNIFLYIFQTKLLHSCLANLSAAIWLHFIPILPDIWQTFNEYLLGTTR